MKTRAGFGDVDRGVPGEGCKKESVVGEGSAADRGGVSLYDASDDQFRGVPETEHRILASRRENGRERRRTYRSGCALVRLEDVLWSKRGQRTYSHGTCGSAEKDAGRPVVGGRQ